jgi:hypothetical protein
LFQHLKRKCCRSGTKIVDARHVAMVLKRGS